MSGIMELDCQSSLNLLKVSPSVVSVVVSIGDKIIRCGSGTVIKIDHADNNNNSTIATILTSAYVIPDLEHSGAETKVLVYLSDAKKTTAKLVGRDVHYNLALIEITVNQTLQAANLQWLDDTVLIDECSHTEAMSSSKTMKVFPGETIITLCRRFHCGSRAVVSHGSYILNGRSYQKSYFNSQFLYFSKERPKFDCQELLYTTCKIAKDFIGGPVINCNMAVIGVTFYSRGYASFLPINVAIKWWEAIEFNRKLCHPSLGIAVGSLLLWNLESVRDLVYKFPEASKGLAVLKVVPSSGAQAAGIVEGDIIVKFDGKVLSSSLEFFEAIWERAGSAVELVIVKVNCDSPLHVNLHIEDVPVEKFNSWPVDEAPETTRQGPLTNFF
ncbi:Serine protease HTRA1 [Rhynchospora pubera]|uniref:Serine protease HTRA1 n=1 Tax=Rhynchospora pubera TaxID=906938 RepID=A0AAV8EV97_9POAL|nr:Serine protease HTRA1 [Rhynchospora pubera]